VSGIFSLQERGPKKVPTPFFHPAAVYIQEAPRCNSPWDMRSDQLEGYTDLCDTQIGERPARIHDIVVDDKQRIHLGENDNHERSPFLWSVRFD